MASTRGSYLSLSIYYHGEHFAMHDHAHTDSMPPNWPISPISCSLVYTDDTIILVDGGIYAISTLSNTLRSLSWAMGLTINFHNRCSSLWTSKIQGLIDGKHPGLLICCHLSSHTPGLLIDTLLGGSPGFLAMAGEWGINFPCNALHACYATP